jgi:hypothetical protein
MVDYLINIQSCWKDNNHIITENIIIGPAIQILHHIQIEMWVFVEVESIQGSLP